MIMMIPIFSSALINTKYDYDDDASNNNNDRNDKWRATKKQLDGGISLSPYNNDNNNYNNDYYQYTCSII